MGKKILDSRFLYIVLSILIAVGLWLYVTVNDEAAHSQTISRIPVTFTGEEILAERGLMLVGGPYYANVTVQATNTVLASLTNQTVQVTANVSGLYEEGSYSVSYTVTPPSGVSPNQFSVVSGVNGNVINGVEVARFSSQEIPIEGEFTGSAAEGYLAGDNQDFDFAPEVVVVSGRLEDVNQVARAVVTIDDEGLTETVDRECPFRLEDRSGNELDLDVTCDVQTVSVRFPIQATAEIPLTVTLADGGGVGADEAAASLSVKSINVAGATEAVEAIKAAGAINLGTIDLAAVSDGEKLTFPVPLADELTNLTGVEEVEVTVRFHKRLEERTFSVRNIRCINVPEGWTAEVITQVLSVTVRGEPGALDVLTEDSLRAVADLQNVTPAAGGYSATVRVYLDSAPSAAEVGVLSGDYRIAINLTQGVRSLPEAP